MTTHERLRHDLDQLDRISREMKTILFGKPDGLKPRGKIEAKKRYQPRSPRVTRPANHVPRTDTSWLIS